MQVVVAEKPSVARDLARALGAKERQDGAIVGNGWCVTWAFGHLAALKTPDEYDGRLKRWSLEHLPFVPAKFELKPNGDQGARQQLERVAALCRGADQLWCATDAGREGELIFRYILEYAGCQDRPFFRLWLSSLTEDSIQKAFAEKKPGSHYENLHAAARSRSEADWIVGLNATRACTVRHGGGKVLWSLGRVQTPVLALIAQRDDEIRVFDARPFWELRTQYKKATFRCALDRSHDEAKAKELLAKVEGQPLTILAVETKEERIPPPLLYDLTQLQRDMNVRFGLSASRTLEVAQQLYEKKLLTYPRTDSRHLSLDLVEPVRQTLGQLRAWNPQALALLAEHVQQDPERRGPRARSPRVFDDAKVSDHHAILPTGRIERLSGEEQRVFDAVATRLVQAFLADKVQNLTQVKAESQGVPFKARGVVVMQQGWSALEPSKETEAAAADGATPKKGRKKKVAGDDDDDAQELPPFTQGESGPHKPFLHEGKTKPPPFYTENTLLGAMETAGKLVDDEGLRQAMKGRGLGTPATRASILETLIARRYVRRDKKTLRVTDLGRYLIAVLADPVLKSPELTGEWEFQLAEIERGKRSRADFMAGIAEQAKALVTTGLSPKPLPDGLGSCPRCGGAVIAGRTAYGCSRWNDGCGFRLPMDYRGLLLQQQHVRELLGRGIVLRPVNLPDQGPRILCCTKNGEPFDIEPPSQEAQRGGKTPAAKPKRRPRQSGG